MLVITGVLPVSNFSMVSIYVKLWI